MSAFDPFLPLGGVIATSANCLESINRVDAVDHCSRVIEPSR